MELRDTITIEIDVPVTYSIEPAQARTDKEYGFDAQVEIISFNSAEALKNINKELDHESVSELLLELAEENKQDSYIEAKGGFPAWLK